MKKRLHMTLLMALAATMILGACGGQSGSSSGQASAGGAPEASGTEWPTGPLTIQVAYGAGGGNDRAVRLLQPYLEKELGVEVVVENTGGAGTELATTQLMQNDAKEGSLIVNSCQPDFYWTLNFQDPAYTKDDVEIMLMEADDPRIILVLPDAPWDTFKDFVEDAKAKPGELSISVVNNTGQHAVALYLEDALGIDMNIVTFDSGSDAMTAMLGGHVNAHIGDAFSRANYVDQAKAIATTNRENSIWPDAIPLTEQFPDLEIPVFNRMSCYLVSKEFVNNNPEGYQKLKDAFLAASKNEEYLSLAAEQKLDTVLVWKDASEYSDTFAYLDEWMNSTLKGLLQ